MALPTPLTITLGTETLSELVTRLREQGVRTNAYADAMLNETLVPIASLPRSVSVEVHTIGALGWPGGAPIDVVLAGVASQGLAPCPLESALVLRLALLESQLTHRITVASERAHADELAPRGFYLRDDVGGAWLRAYVASDDWVMSGEEHLALLRV